MTFTSNLMTVMTFGVSAMDYPSTTCQCLRHLSIKSIFQKIWYQVLFGNGLFLVVRNTTCVVFQEISTASIDIFTRCLVHIVHQVIQIENACTNLDDKFIHII